MSQESSKTSKLRTEPDVGEAFVRLLMEHESRVRSFLRGLLPTWNDVDEVIQEASLIAWRKFGEFEEGTEFGGWFLTIARFEALKYRRRIARSPLVFSEDVCNLLADEAMENQNQQIRKDQLQACLDKLTREKRAILLKAHSPGTVIREIAQQSGKSEQAFYKVVQRLRSVLLDCVTQLKAAEGTA